MDGTLVLPGDRAVLCCAVPRGAVCVQAGVRLDSCISDAVEASLEDWEANHTLALWNIT